MPGLQDTRLITTDRDSPNARDLVDVLQRKTQRLLNRADRLPDVVNRLMERRALVPRHVLRMLSHVVAVEPRDEDK